MRPDLVDIALASQVAAARYVEPAPALCSVPRTAMRAAADPAAVAVSELLYGEAFDVFDIAGEWAFGRSVHDRYTGWVRAATLAEPAADPTAVITAAIAPLFSAEDIKSAVIAELPFGARVSGVPGDRFLAVSGGGYLHNRHLAPLPADHVQVAARFTGAPYLWGGRTPAGVDCSGLVQATLAAFGTAAPRDSDMQQGELGREIAFEDRRRGDIVFFPGHVGILVDADTLLHANAFWMTTLAEPLADVIDRLRGAGVVQPVSAVRRVFVEGR